MSSIDPLSPPPTARTPARIEARTPASLPFAGRYRTLLLVVDEDAADGLLDTLCHHDGRLFAISDEGLTPAALEAGADPQEWALEDEEEMPDTETPGYTHDDATSDINNPTALAARSDRP